VGFRLSWGKHVLDLDRRTHVMGILNVTPDSFSDGGHYYDPDRAVAHGLEMARQGADIIDVGGESTRPYAKEVSAREELKRVIPVIRALAGALEIPISIDTCKSEVAGKALAAGASIINDISALRFDPVMGSLAADAGVPVVLMHMLGRPKDMQVNPKYDEVVRDVMEFLIERMSAAGWEPIPWATAAAPVVSIERFGSHLPLLFSLHNRGDAPCQARITIELTPLDAASAGSARDVVNNADLATTVRAGKLSFTVSLDAADLTVVEVR